MTTSLSIMSGELGDIFWDLPPVVSYLAGLDLGCSIHVANPTDQVKEYALMAQLYRSGTLISEEALPVFGYTWFKVEPGDAVKLNGALRFAESDVSLMVSLVEKETEEVTDKVTTQLVQVSTSVLPPWLGGSTTTTTDWSSLLGLILPFMLLGMIVVALKPQSEKRENIAQAKEEKKLLPAGRQS